MTNKEKAEALYPTDFNYLGSGVINVPIKEREAFVKGAEWKDEQVKQYLLHGKKYAQEKGNQDLVELFEIIIEDLKL